MIRTKNLVLTSTAAQELTFYDAVEAPCTIIISNNSANKHVFVGGANVSTTNYGIMISHDNEPVTIKLPAFERLYAVSDNLDVACSVLVIEG